MAQAMCPSCEYIEAQANWSNTCSKCSGPCALIEIVGLLSTHKAVHCLGSCGHIYKTLCYRSQVAPVQPPVLYPLNPPLKVAPVCQTCDSVPRCVDITLVRCAFCNKSYGYDPSQLDNGHLVVNCDCHAGHACLFRVFSIAVLSARINALANSQPNHAAVSVNLLPPEVKRVTIRCPTGCGETLIDEEPGPVVVLGCGCRFTQSGAPRMLAELRKRINEALKEK